MPKKLKKKKQIKTHKLSLPENVSKVKENLEDYSILIYGAKKIGKTTLATQFKDPLFIMFEPGVESLKVYAVYPKIWEEFVEYIQLFLKDKRFYTLVIDTPDKLYSLALDYVCRCVGVDHPSDIKDFGLTWSKISKELVKTLKSILPINSGKGLLALSHATSRDIEVVKLNKENDIITQEVSIVCPTMEHKVLEFFDGMMDIIGYYGYIKNERIITIRGNEFLDAGCRLKYNFKTVNGKKVVSIPCGLSEEQAYKNIVKAFNNKQKLEGGYIEKTILKKKKSKKKRKI